MRGHQLSTQRRLNKHWQSAGSGIQLPAIPLNYLWTFTSILDYVMTLGTWSGHAFYTDTTGPAYRDDYFFKLKRKKVKIKFLWDGTQSYFGRFTIDIRIFLNNISGYTTQTLTLYGYDYGVDFYGISPTVPTGHTPSPVEFEIGFDSIIYHYVNGVATPTTFAQYVFDNAIFPITPTPSLSDVTDMWFRLDEFDLSLNSSDLPVILKMEVKK